MMKTITYNNLHDKENQWPNKPPLERIRCIAVNQAYNMTEHLDKLHNWSDYCIVLADFIDALLADSSTVIKGKTAEHRFNQAFTVDAVPFGGDIYHTTHDMIDILFINPSTRIQNRPSQYISPLLIDKWYKHLEAQEVSEV